MLNKKLIVIPLLLVTLNGHPINGSTLNSLNTPNTLKVETRELDQRAKILSAYFASYGSPFQYHAQDFIDAADEYGVDWKLVPSIAGVESTFGKKSYGYNAWGWGIYGNQTLDFDSWRTGIYTVTGGLKENYIDKGLTNPYTMNKKYAASPSWGWKVNFFMNDLDRFAESYQQEKAQKTQGLLAKTAGASAQVR